MLQFAKIDVSAGGDNVVVLGNRFPNRRIMVISYSIISDADVTVKWKSNSTDLSGPMAIAAKGGITVTSNFVIGAGGGPLGIFQTLNGEDDLVLNLSGAAAVGGHITYFVLNG